MLVQTAKNAWQQALGEMITRPQELLELLDLSPEQLGLSQAAAKQFSCRVPREFVAKMQLFYITSILIWVYMI